MASSRDPAGACAAVWCKSNFSFLEGASHPDELVESAHALGLRALALTDRDGVHGIVRAHVKARELGLHLVVGSQVTLADGSTVVLLCQDRKGYANLCRLVTRGRRRSPKGTCSVSWEEVAEHAAGLLALWGGGPSLLSGEVEPLHVAGLLKDALEDRCYALVARHREAGEVEPESRLRRRARRYGFPVVAAVEVLYHAPARQPLHDVITCTRHGVDIHHAGRHTRANALHALPGPATLAVLFRDDKEAVARTVEVAERCDFSLQEIRYRYPLERLPDGTTSSRWLRELTLQGARERYGTTVPPGVTAQLERELSLIEELDYGGYFLTMREIVVYCRAHGILCQGRGSAANSAVCYCLGITAIDPVRMGLLFERFISRERAEPPDIDLDIAHQRREEVIQHVYAKYGRTHAAMVANVIRYRPRSAMRDVGKALGVAQTTLDRLSKTLSHYESPTVEDLRAAGLDPDLPVHGHLLRLVTEIQGFPRHLSIHPGGFILGHEPVHDLVPIENATMEGRTVIQWDKDDVEALGLFKVDLLGLGALAQLDRAFTLLKTHRGVDLSMATVPPADAATFDMVCRGDTVGVFQIESRAQMSMLPRLRPRCFYDLVIEVGIVRPGPISGGMVHPYLRRRHGLEPVEYAHPLLRPVLEKTMGVPIFQEQVMRIAMIAADYTPGEADQLRRDMAAWRRGGKLEAHRERIIGRMEGKGIARGFAERVFSQIMGFAEYGFPESHAASFALISYVSAWLKCHHPLEFTCSLLNAQPMGFYSSATIMDDAKRHGVTVLPVDVTRSAWDCTLEGEPLGLRVGLRWVKGLAEQGGQRIVTAREERTFSSLADLVARTGLDEGSLDRLVESGALETLAGDRRAALWETRGLKRTPPAPLPLTGGETLPLFPGLTRFETIAWDYRATGHSARGHPLSCARPSLQAQGLPTAREVSAMPDGKPVRYAGLVICRQRPGTAKGVTFMTLEDETGFVNLVVWTRVYERFRLLVRTSAFLGVTGKLQVQEGVVHLVAQELWTPRVGDLPALGASRDFR
jgi:error-prone DNA polymerase